METCILSCVKQIASPGSMHETGCSGLVHWGDPGGWDGDGGGGGYMGYMSRTAGELGLFYLDLYVGYIIRH